MSEVNSKSHSVPNTRHLPRNFFKGSIEAAIARLLRIGVFLCSSLITLGLALRMSGLVPLHMKSSQMIQDMMAGRELGQEMVPRSLSEFVTQLRFFDPDAIISLGLLLLIVLPIIRVGMAAVLFVVEQDKVYVGIALFVLTMLLSSLFLPI